MNILQKFLNRLAQPAINAANNSNLYNQAIFQYLSNRSVIWIGDNPGKYIDEGYYLNPDVYAAINVIVRLASTAPLNLYKIVDKKALRMYKSLLSSLPSPETEPEKFYKHIKQVHEYKTKALEEVFDHKILERLENPNEYQSKGEFLENAYGFRLTTGNFIVFKAKAKVGKPEVMALYHLPPHMTNIISGGIMEPIKQYIVGYIPNEEMAFDKGDIIHNRSWSLDYSGPGSHLFGTAPLRAANRALTMGNDGRAAQTWMLQNRGSDVLLTLDPEGLKSAPTPQQQQDLKDQMNTNVNGKHNKGKVSFAVGKFNVHQMGMTAVDMGIDGAIKLSTADICKVYGISPILLANMDSSTFSNYKEAKKAAITQAAIPLLISVRDSLNKDLLPEYEPTGYMLDFDLTVYPELQEDRKDQVSYLQNANWLTLNEKRTEMGYGQLPDENMNKIYITSSLTPLEQVNTPELLNDVNADTGDY